MDGLLSRAGRLLRWFVRPFASQEPSFYRAVTACLLAAGVFWQMNALNKTYTTRLDLPLRWRYDTARYAALRPLPARVAVTVTGQGWRLLRANLGLGVRPPELRPVPRPGTRYLPPAARRELLAALEPLQVNEWAGDTLRLTFDRLATRTLAVVLRSDPAHPQSRFAADVQPATVQLRGPATLLANLPNPLQLSPPDYPAPGNETNEVLPLADLPPLVQARPAQVRVRLRGLK